MSIRRWRTSADHDVESATDLPGLAPQDKPISTGGDAAAADADRSVDAAAVGHVHAELVELRTLFENRIRYDETREAQFSKLYDELESYKKAEASERMLGLARGILLIIDQIEAGSATDTTEIAEDLLDCLAAEGIEPIEDATVVSHSGLEQVVGFTDGETPEMVRRGYRFGDLALRPRQVLAPQRHDGGPR